MNKIKLLDASLFEYKEKLNELTYWLRVMNRPNGWHYDLDHIWILNELEKAGIKRGATVLDAGAGQGIMQYLLASRGINVISLDFSPRAFHPRTKGIFDIRGDGDKSINYKHGYMDFITYGDSHKKNMNLNIGYYINKLKNVGFLNSIKKALRNLRSYAYYLHERFLNGHDAYGEITFLRMPFHEMNSLDKKVDAVISVSAIEHADINLFRDNVESMLSVLKPSGVLLLTTSATDFIDNNFHEKSQGWCFSKNQLREFLGECDVEFDMEKCKSSLLESKVLRKRLEPYYYKDEDSFCFDKKIVSFPYFPVSVKIVK